MVRLEQPGHHELPIALRPEVGGWRWKSQLTVVVPPRRALDGLVAHRNTRSVRTVAEDMGDRTSRRRWLQGAATSGLTIATGRAWALEPRLRPTPKMTAGPFYPSRIPDEHDANLVRFAGATAKGEVVLLNGVLKDRHGRPVRNGRVEIWQCDSHGTYHHVGQDGPIDDGFQGYGVSTTDDAGRFHFRTIRPVPYGGRTPHIHVKASNAAGQSLTTQWFDADQRVRNERDFLYSGLSGPDRERLMMQFVRVRAASESTSVARLELILP